jgi:hypothetical protein
LIRAVVVAAALVTLAGGSAQADTLVEFPKSTVQLTLPDGWTAMNATGVAAAYKHDAGLVLAVTRADVPNPDAWVAEKKQAYADKVERGIKAKLPGYKRLAKKLGDANGVPVLDVEARREGGATVVVRVLLFRTYALSLAIEVPKGGDVAAARAIAKGFAPPKPAPKP